VTPTQRSSHTPSGPDQACVGLDLTCAFPSCSRSGANGRASPHSRSAAARQGLLPSRDSSSPPRPRTRTTAFQTIQSLYPATSPPLHSAYHAKIRLSSRPLPCANEEHRSLPPPSTSPPAPPKSGLGEEVHAAFPRVLGSSGAASRERPGRKFHRVGCEQHAFQFYLKSHSTSTSFTIFCRDLLLIYASYISQ
jgi:hypothetical protein